MLHSILRRVTYIAAIVVILFAILIALARATSPYLNQHRDEYAARVSDILHLPVKIASISGSWQGLQPIFKLKNISLQQANTENTVLNIGELDIGINLFQSLLHWSIQPGTIGVQNTNMQFIEDAQGQWSLAGMQTASNTHTNNGDSIRNWFLQRDNINLQHVTANFTRYKKSAIYFNIAYLNLHMTGAKNAGKLAVSGEGITFNLPEMFREPQKLSRINTTLSWQQRYDAWLIGSNNLDIGIPNAVIHSKLNLVIPANTDTSSTIDMAANIAIKQFAKKDIYTHLPIGVLSPEVLSWLDENILALGKTDVSFVLRGALADFPFDHNNGEFMIKAGFNDTSMQLSEGWPTVKGLQGSMVFAGRSMDIHATSGNLSGMKISDARAVIPYMGDAQPVILTVTATAKADATQALIFLRDSPLKSYLQQGLETTTAQGSLNAELKLTIPLSEENADPIVNGVVNLQKVNAQFPAWQIALNKLQGALNFSQNGLSTERITGIFLGAPLVLTIEEPNSKNQYNTIIGLEGQLDSKILEAQYHLPLSLFVEGKTKVKGEIAIDEAKTVTLSLQSDLQGVKLHLPQPLQKDAPAVVPLRVKIQNKIEQPLTLDFTYGRFAGGNVQLSSDHDKWLFKSGTIILGSNKISQQQHSGLQVMANLPVCSTTVWRSKLAQIKALTKQSNTPTNWPVWLNNIVLHCDQLVFGGQTINNADVTIADSSKATTLQIQAAEAAGSVVIPHLLDANNSINLQFNRLYANAPVAGSISNFEVKQLPELNFSINDFRYAERKFGAISGTISSGKQAARFNININQDKLLTLKASGIWSFTSGNTNINGVIDSTNTSLAMKNMGFSSNLKSAQAQIEFKLNWLGAPYQFDSAKLNGNVNINIRNGMILGLKKGTDAMVGLGRIINLLTLDSLSDRLSSGFSNVKQSGFPFTAIIGEFSLRAGVASTNDASIKSNVADISFIGSSNLANQTYDLNMKVVPHLTSSIPVVATLAGGPVVGAVAWVANKALSPAVDFITQYQYTVTGTWKDPKIQKK